MEEGADGYNGLAVQGEGGLEGEFVEGWGEEVGVGGGGAGEAGDVEDGEEGGDGED